MHLLRRTFPRIGPWLLDTRVLQHPPLSPLRLRDAGEYKARHKGQGAKDGQVMREALLTIALAGKRGGLGCYAAIAHHHRQAADNIEPSQTEEEGADENRASRITCPMGWSFPNGRVRRSRGYIKRQSRCISNKQNSLLAQMIGNTYSQQTKSPGTKPGLSSQRMDCSKARCVAYEPVRKHLAERQDCVLYCVYASV